MKIQIDHLSFGYLKRPLSVVDFSCKIKNGEIVSVLGMEGMGKTSLLRVVSGLEKQFVGKIWFNNVDSENLNIAERKISFIASEPVILKNKTIKQNLDFFSKVNGVNLDDEQIQKTFKLFDFNFDLKTKMKKLSSANQKVFTIVRSFLKEPDLVLIDDLFENESKENVQILKNAILTMICNKNKQTSVICVENLENLFLNADQYFYFSFGKATKIESIEFLKTNPIDMFCASAFLKFSKSLRLLFDGNNFYLRDQETIKNKKSFDVVLKRQTKLSDEFKQVLSKQKLDAFQDMAVCLFSDFDFENLKDETINEMLKKNQIFVFDENTFVKII